MAASIFKRRSTVASSDLKRLSQTEAAQAQSSFNIEKITEIQNCFPRGEIILVPGRIFIREGILWKVCRKGTKKRQFFLFNDILIYGSILSRGYYSNQHILPINSMTVSAKCHYMPQVELETSSEHNSEELDPENAFQINHADKSFHVFAMTKADKTNWITNLTKQINKLNQGEENAPMVYKPVWVPDSVSKQCLICSQKFSAFVRKHHCRMCGRLVCSQCSPGKGDIAQLSGAPPNGKLERICKQCNKPLIVKTGGGPMEESVDGGGGGGNTTSKATSETNNDDGDSTETEDSDDSENEIIPVPPPRKKKQLKEETTPPTRPKQGPPPRPAPPKLSSPSLKKIPPNRPTSPPEHPTSRPSRPISAPGRPTSPPQRKIDKNQEEEEEKVVLNKEESSHKEENCHQVKEEASDVDIERPKPAPRQGKQRKDDESNKQEQPSPRPIVAKRTKFLSPTEVTSNAVETPPIESSEMPPTESIDAPLTVPSVTPPTESIDAPLTVPSETPPTESIDALPTVPSETPPTESIDAPLTESSEILPEESTETPPNESIEIETPPVESSDIVTLPMESIETPPTEAETSRTESLSSSDINKVNESQENESHIKHNGQPTVETPQILKSPSTGGRSPSMNARPRRSKFAVSATTSNS